ncbi:MAG: hypothetical protein Q9210_003420 [Variospora velana]
MGPWRSTEEALERNDFRRYGGASGKPASSLHISSVTKKHDYIRLSLKTNSWVLDTSILPQRLTDLVRSAKKRTLASKFGLPDLKSVGEYWDQVFWIAKLENDMFDWHINRSLDMNLMLAQLPVSILLVSLRRMADRIFWRNDLTPTLFNTALVPAKFSLWQMMESDWCNQQSAAFYRVHTPFLNHYLSGLPRRSNRSSHEECTWNRCVGDNVRLDIYVPKHVKESCYCEYMGPDKREIADHVNAGRVPLIGMSVHNGQPSLTVAAAEIDTQFMSISHVWIGGLGNFEDNKLPRCQLLRLYALLKSLESSQPSDPPLELFRSGFLTRLSGSLMSVSAQLSPMMQPFSQVSSADRTSRLSKRPVLFWMDTLCIPVNPLRKDLRLKAINNMALTYAAAEKCLVLDPELQQISMEGLSTTQLNAHVLCSSWSRRSWTFQEARLSRIWYAQFADGLWNPNSVENAALEHRLYSDWNVEKSDEHQLACESIMWYHDMPASRRVDILRNQSQRTLLHYPAYNFMVGWNNLVSRSTSKPEDVHGIFAITLDLNAGEVTALPLQDRMKAILGAQETVSAGVVYSRGQKIQDPETRWVPIFPSESYLSDNYGQMKRVEGGYLLENVKFNPVGFLVDKTAPRYSQLRILESSGATRPLWIHFYHEDEGPTIDFEAPGETLAVCYVVGDLKSSNQNHVCRRMQGARFALRRIEGSVLHLVYEYSFSYTHRNFDLRNDEHDYPILYAKRTAEDAIFQVDCDFTSWPTLSYRRDTSSEHSVHGLYVYMLFWALFFASIWTPFYYSSVLSTRPPRLLLPTVAYVLRASAGCFELRRMQKRVNEHAYKAWVKTFDDAGCMKRRLDTKHGDRGLQFGIRVKVSLGTSMGSWLLAILVPGWGYLRWFGVAMLVEVMARWGVEAVWWRTGVRKVVKGFLKERGWW